MSTPHERDIAPLLLLKVDLGLLIKTGVLGIYCVLDAEIDQTGMKAIQERRTVSPVRILHDSPFELGVDDSPLRLSVHPSPPRPKENQFKMLQFTPGCDIESLADFRQEIMYLLITRFAVMNDPSHCKDLVLRQIIPVIETNTLEPFRNVPVIEICNYIQRDRYQMRMRAYPSCFIGLHQPDDPEKEAAVLRYLFNWFVFKTKETLDAQKRQLYHGIFGLKK